MSIISSYVRCPFWTMPWASFLSSLNHRLFVGIRWVLACRLEFFLELRDFYQLPPQARLARYKSAPVVPLLPFGLQSHRCNILLGFFPPFSPLGPPLMLRLFFPCPLWRVKLQVSFSCSGPISVFFRTRSLLPSSPQWGRSWYAFDFVLILGFQAMYDLPFLNAHPTILRSSRGLRFFLFSVQSSVL